MAILKTEDGIVQLYKCEKCLYLVMWVDFPDEKKICKWCAAEHRVHADAGDSTASTSLTNASAESASQTETKPAQRG